MSVYAVTEQSNQAGHPAKPSSLYTSFTKRRPFRQSCCTTTSVKYYVCAMVLEVCALEAKVLHVSAPVCICVS